LVALFVFSALFTYGAALAFAQNAAPDTSIASSPPSATAQGVLQHSGIYQVVAGDTLYGIARRFDLSVEALRARNGLATDAGLVAGQPLRIYRAQTSAARPTTPPSLDPADEAVGLHAVAPGETLYAIARRYGVTVESLAQHNALTVPFTLTIGQRLRLPNPPTSAASATRAIGAVTSASQPPPTRPYQEAMQERAAASPSPPDAQFAAAAGRDRALGSEDAAPGQSQVLTYASSLEIPTNASERMLLDTPPPPRSSNQFLWPTRGRILAAYGAQEDGMRNDGINIAVDLGTEIKAADAGLVSYVGRGVRGFGLLILLTHEDDWTTVYANTTESYVQVGQQVEAGTRIAAIREPLSSEHRPQLHFEVRLNGRAVDPLRYLGN
jgi:murein DD-endopeptidase MepM/ murein hydrolase activator NlpD